MSHTAFVWAKRPVAVRLLVLAAVITAAMAPAAGAGSEGRSALCESSASPGLCRGIDVLIDGPWIYKDMSLAYRTGAGNRVRWRVQPKAHQTVAVDFSVSTSTDRFQTFRHLDIYLPSMRFRALPPTAFQGSAQPRVTVDGDHLLWRATPLSRVGRGGFSHEFLAITLPTGKTQVCPRLEATFTDRVLIYQPACWRIKST